MPLVKPINLIHFCLQYFAGKGRHGFMLALLIFILPLMVLASGETGNNGKSGPSGNSGRSGPSGNSGKSGPSGSADKSGPSGNEGNNENTGKADRFAEADKYAESEILITINVSRIGFVELPAIIYGQDVYLPVNELFDFLKIKNTLSPNLDSCYGFFINPNAPFLIDNAQSEIQFQDNIYKLNYDDIVQTETGLFLKISFFGEVFGLDCDFSFRSLSIKLTTKIELPAIREMQLELMRRNLSELRGERKADTTIARKFNALKLGMLDWGINSFMQTGKNIRTIIGLSTGGIVLGGEATARINASIDKKIDISQLIYNWRYVNNNNKFVKQINVGLINPGATTFINGAINGISLSNTPTKYRRSFGTYTLTDKTEPGWTVELYINDILVNYTKADASGIFVFEVPMVYGNSVIKLRHFGPWGEEFTTEKVSNIPFNFVPVNQIEYNFSAGVVGDSSKGIFSRVSGSYGVNKYITIGGGMEYYSALRTGVSMPYITASVRLAKNVLVSAEKIHNVRSKYNVNYRTKSNIQLDVNYIKYDKDQTAVKFFNAEERKAIVTFPIKSKLFSAYTRLAVNQIVSHNSKITNGELMLTGKLFGINSNLTTTAVMSGGNRNAVFSILSSSFKIPGRMTANSQIQYDYNKGNVTMIGVNLAKSIGNKYFLTFNYQNTVTSNTHTFGVGIRCNLKFSSASLSVNHNNNITTTVQSLSGSLIFDNKTHTVIANRNSNIGRGGLIVYSFLDLNGNGKKDSDEPRVKGMNIKIGGGGIMQNKKDTSVLITNLEAYSNYFIETDNIGFDNVSWRLKYKTFNVEIDPNYLKVLEVPVLVLGEVSGSVFITSYGSEKGTARMLVDIYDENGNLVTKTLSESDGYFTFLGLAPGNYMAKIDEKQLKNLNLICMNDELNFTIRRSIQGDMVEGLAFDIRHLEMNK